MTDLHVDPYEVHFISIYSIFIYSFHKSQQTVVVQPQHEQQIKLFFLFSFFLTDAS